MEGLDVLQAVQFVTVKGKRLAVMSAEDWEALIEWLETTEDIKIAGKAAAELEAAAGDRQRAGWRRWEHAIASQASDLRPASSKQLQAPEFTNELRRLRLDRWRIVYSVTETDRIVDVLGVRKRPPCDYGDLGSLLEGIELT